MDVTGHRGNEIIARASQADANQTKVSLAKTQAALAETQARSLL